MGTDLSPIQPNFVPPNCRFEVDDFEDEWVYSQKFDYIHGRDIFFSLANPPRLLAEIYENLEPGGWVEFLETVPWLNSVDGTLENTATQRWNRLVLQGMHPIRHLNPFLF
jgi:trans-aconitate methyltransferase